MRPRLSAAGPPGSRGIWRPRRQEAVGAGSHGKCWLLSAHPNPIYLLAFPIGPNVPQSTCVPLCLQPKGRALGALGAAPPAGPSPDPQELHGARARAWEAGQKAPRIWDSGSQCSLGLFLTQKSKLYLIFRNRPPTIAARWMTSVGWTCSNSARVCAASLWGSQAVRGCLEARGNERPGSRHWGQEPGRTKGRRGCQKAKWPGQVLAGRRVWTSRKRKEEVCPGAKLCTPWPGQPSGREGPDARPR